jgi:hypothetical protein
VQPESTKAVQCGYITVGAHSYTNTQARVVVVLAFRRENVHSKASELGTNLPRSDRSGRSDGHALALHSSFDSFVLVLCSASADVGYHKQRADYYDHTSSRRHQATLSSFVSKGNDGGAEGGKLVVLGEGGDGEAASLSLQALHQPSFRLQTCSTAALTLTLDVCCCKAELAAVMRALNECFLELVALAKMERDQSIEACAALQKELRNQARQLKLQEDELFQV